MKLTDYTDYTLRVLIYLALHPDQLVTIQQIAEGYRISKNHLMKIVNQLSQSGLVVATRGRNGGVRLARPAAQVNTRSLPRNEQGNKRPARLFEAIEMFVVSVLRSMVTAS